MSLKVFLATIGLILCILALVYFLTPKSKMLSGAALVASQIKAERDYKAAGLPWEAKELVGNFRPSGKSAMKIADAFPKLPKSFDDWYPTAHKKTWSGDFSLAAKRLKEFDKLLDQAKRTLQAKKLYFGWKLDQGLACLFPELSTLKGYGKLLSLRASLEAHQGKREESLSDFSACVKLGNLCSTTPILIGSLVHVAIDKIALKDLAEARYSLGNDAIFATQSERRVDRLTVLPSLKDSLRTEAFLHIASGRNLSVDGKGIPMHRSTGWATDILMTNFELRAAQFWTLVFKQAGANWGDYSKVNLALQEATQKVPQLSGLSKEIDPLGGDGITSSVARIWYGIDEWMEVDRCYVKAIDYWHRHRTLPKKLSELEPRINAGIDKDIAITKTNSGFKFTGQIAVPPQLQSDDPDENEPRQINITFPPTQDDHW